MSWEADARSWRRAPTCATSGTPTFSSAGRSSPRAGPRRSRSIASPRSIARRERPASGGSLRRGRSGGIGRRGGLKILGPRGRPGSNPGSGIRVKVSCLKGLSRGISSLSSSGRPAALFPVGQRVPGARGIDLSLLDPVPPIARASSRTWGRRPSPDERSSSATRRSLTASPSTGSPLPRSSSIWGSGPSDSPSRRPPARRSAMCARPTVSRPRSPLHRRTHHPGSLSTRSRSRCLRLSPAEEATVARPRPSRCRGPGPLQPHVLRRN